MANQTKRKDFGGGMIFVDTEPTAGSENPVAGGGVRAAIDAATTNVVNKVTKATEGESATAAENATVINALIDALIASGIMKNT